jgi:TrkA domain protein
MAIQETALPGVGLRHEFTTRDGRQLGVVSYRTGRRDLLLYDRDDPDACREVIRFTDQEADALAELLGAARLTGRLAELQQQIEGLAISWLTIQESSPYAGGTIADTQARSRTGASIVAVLRAQTAFPRANPQLRLPGQRHGAGGRAPRPASGPWPDSWTADRHGQRDPGSQARRVALGQTITTPSPEHLPPWPDPRVAPVSGLDSTASRFDRRASTYEDSTLQEFLFVPVQQTALRLALQLLPQARRGP